EAIGHAAGTKEQACLLTVLAGATDLVAGLGVWVVGLGGLEPPTSSLSVRNRVAASRGSARSVRVEGCGQAWLRWPRLLSSGVVSLRCERSVVLPEPCV